MFFPVRVFSRADAVLKVVEQELPESAALLRLSGLEMTECLTEVSSLGSELSCGVRSTARMVTSVEQGVKQSVEGIDRVITQGLLPMAARTETAARSKSSLPQALGVIKRVAIGCLYVCRVFMWHNGQVMYDLGKY
jgi:hypothetical protein